MLKVNVKWDEFARWSLLVGHGVSLHGKWEEYKNPPNPQQIDRKMIIFV